MAETTRPMPRVSGIAEPVAKKPFIEIRNLSVRYTADRPLALVDLDLTLTEGEFVCIVGPSGCGKSTLMHVLSGLLAPAAGDVRIAGENLYAGGRGHDLRVGYVFQDHRLLPWRTVRQNLEIALRASKVPKAEQRGRIERYLKMLQIEDFVDAWPMRLSGGQRQRVSIARALAIDPTFMLMDEPYSTLDEVTARTMRTELLDIWAETAKTVIFVTHSIREAVFLADRVIVLTRGPGRILTELHVDVRRPRLYEDIRIAELEAEIIELALTHWGIDPLG